MKVAFLGPKGTYTHQAAEKYFENFEPFPCSNLREVFETEADAAVIPFENSLGGSITESVDLLREKDAEVTGEESLKINHVLASNCDRSQIQTVKSHPQALEQCSDIIEKEGWGTREAKSTAKAAENLDKGKAVICSRIAAELNNLQVLEERVQDNESNATRFLVLDHKKEEQNQRTLMILEPEENREGILASMLSCFSGHEINLSYIQSRPTKNQLGKYYFCIEAEGSRNELKMRKALSCVETYAEVTVLGSY